MNFCRRMVVVLAAGIAIFTAGCAGIVERNETGLKVTEVKRGELRIRGATVSDFNYESSVREVRSGNEIHIFVHERAVFHHVSGKEVGGPFDYTLKVPDDVDTVTFGRKKTVIWTRGH